MTITKLRDLLELVALSGTRFITKNYPIAPVGAKGTFGGTLVAQSLLSSLNTVPKNFVPTSLHCYFISGGNPNEMIQYDVKSLRQGRNFIHKQVDAYQFDKLIFSSMILFSKDKNPKTTIDHGDDDDNIKYHKTIGYNVDDKSQFERASELFKKDILDNEINLKRFQRLNQKFNDPTYLKKVHESFQTHPLDYKFPLDIFRPDRKEYSKFLEYFVRVRRDSITIPSSPDPHMKDRQGNELITPENDPRYNYVAFAYLSDSYLLLTLPYFHGLPMYSHTFSVSLDHTIYFHHLPKVNDWLRLQLHNIRSMSDRHLIQCEHYDAQSGQIMASVSQEGLVVYPPVSHIKARL